ncbi:GAF domain-containing protein [Streptomyces rhizosphaerihabitans]|uniref:GAF domain-containing protein n=1 Tax=Streptomyces rhizosphaerihabitans TaxID=1266770 RepID=UPI0021C102EC|nr:GAF domain-containing protein [Streptomyces rhizosphaerihabitans]MCT9009486.1 GAF domain-containing protein [Streptomyces rhizosphaerihabitans]
MSREQQITEAFVGLTDIVADDVDPTVLLHRLVSHCVTLTAVDAAGVMLATARGGLRAIAVTDDRAAMVELFQIQTGQGPCVDSWRTAQAVSAPDLSVFTDRWPVFVPFARTVGYAGTYAFPLRVRDQAVGALNLLTRTTGALTGQDTGLLQALADVAAIAVVQWTVEPLRPADIVTRVQATVSSKAATDTAVGMLAAAGSLTVQEAARALRRCSGIRHQRSTEVAQALIRRELSPETVLGESR